jgi:hypothetical protein
MDRMCINEDKTGSIVRWLRNKVMATFDGGKAKTIFAIVSDRIWRA